MDHGLRQDLVPVAVNPNVSEQACQVSLSSSVFRDTIAASGTLLLIDPRDMTASEWLRLLVLLAMKCAASDVLQSVISKMENECAEQMAAPLEKTGKAINIAEILPLVDMSLDNSEDFDYSNLPSIKIAVPESKSVTQDANEDSDSAVSISGVTDDVVPGRVVSSTDPDNIGSEVCITAAEIATESRTIPFEGALMEKRRRQKITEDSFAAYNIKNQIKSTVSSFEEDTFSPVVDACLSSTNSPMDFFSLRCRRIHCEFCGLMDQTLGSPLLRVPNEDEWNQLMPHLVRSRRTHLVAEMPVNRLTRNDEDSRTKVVSVKIIVKDDLFSVPLESGDGLVDGGMLELLPRSSIGFESELRFRYETRLPFITGSLSAHECCAVAVHNARKEQMVQRYREREAELIEKEYGTKCARTLEIGRDVAGKSFWKFESDPTSLFVCSSGSSWYRFSEPASIASVIVSLGRDFVSRDLRRHFPEAAKLADDGTWSNILLMQRFPIVVDIMNGKGVASQDDRKKDVALEVEGGFDVSTDFVEFSRTYWEMTT